MLGKANPDRMNGVNKVAHQLALSQHALGHDVYIYGITQDPYGAFPSRAYSTKLFQSHFNKLKIDKALREDLISLANTDTIVHFHAGYIPEFYAISRLLIRLNIPYVLTPHGNFMQGALDKNKFIKQIYFNLIESKLLLQAKAVHCLGEGERNDLLKLNNKVKTAVVPNGQNQNDTSVKNWSGTSSDIVFGFCGRFTRAQKGLDILLLGFEIYKNTYNGKGHLSLIGDGDYLKEFNQQAFSKGLSPYIKTWGGLFGEQKNNVMSQMDVFCHTSRNEGMPMAVLESATMGIPSLVSEFTNMTGYVSQYNAGYCLQNNTPAEVAKMMVQAENDFIMGKLQQLGANARKMVVQEFDWSSIAQKLIALYKK